MRAMKQLPLRHSRRKSIRRCLRRFCCSCLPSDEMENEMNGDGQRGKQGSREAIQISVGDLGTVNCSFSLLEEDHLTLWSSGAPSATSMTVSPRPLRKKPLQPLPSLTVPPQAAAGEADEEEREEMSIDDPEASGRLPEQLVINLIPPTPAAVANRARFFDGNLEGSVEPGPERSKSPGGMTHNVAVRGSKEESKETEAGVGVVAESGERPNVEERDTLTNKEEDKDEAKSGLLRSACHVVSLHQHPLKSEPPSLFSPKQN